MVAEIDVSELLAVATELDSLDVMPELVPTVRKAAKNVQDELKKEARESEHFARVAGRISFDTTVSADSVDVSLGPRKGGAGSLAHIAYFGGSAWSGRKNPGRGWQQGPGGGGTLPDPDIALQAEAPTLERFVGEILEGLIK